jgi:CBS domain-containing protein
MAQVCDLLKDRPLYSVDASLTVLEAATYMMERNIGAVPVLMHDELVGIFSERDVMNRVVAGRRDAGHTRVDEVMTHNPRRVAPTETLESCMFLMREHGFRHLPVCEGSKLKGLISLRDILLRDLSEKDDEVRQMRAYIGGSVSA